MNKNHGEFTYKEIFMQPESFEAVDRDFESTRIILDQAFAESYEEVIFTGCGTSFYLAQSAAQAFSAFQNLPARAVCCSELYFFADTYLKNRKTLVLPVTRKSCTTEVRMAIDRVREFPNVKTLAITCDSGSSDYNDFMIVSPDALEKSVVMTRSFTSMLYLAIKMSAYLGGAELQGKGKESLAASAREALKRADSLAKRIVEENFNLNLFITLGQGIYFGAASECMNKMKEMGIANSEAYYSLEYRHGPMSLADENTLIILLSHSRTVDQEAGLLSEMKEYGAVTVAVGDHADVKFPEADYSMSLNYGYPDEINCIMAGFIGQLIGYYVAEKKGIDADCPRHLSQAIILP